MEFRSLDVAYYLPVKVAYALLCILKRKVALIYQFLVYLGHFNIQYLSASIIITFAPINTTWMSKLANGWMTLMVD